MKLETLFPVPGNAGNMPPVADIVFVHGLESPPRRPASEKRMETWTAEDGTIWPRKLLLGKQLHVRVLCYQYNGSIRGTANKASIRERAWNLLDQLSTDECHRDPGKQRPIIFVGHSLGGVIIKQALVSARDNPRYRHLGRATCGIVFFATPHHLGGSEGGRQFANRLLRAVIARYGSPSLVDTVMGVFRPALPTAEMIQDIEKNSNTLTYLTADFQDARKDFRVSVVNFYELEKTKALGEVVVNQADTYLDEVNSQPLSGDHLGICKFCDDETGRGRLEPVLEALKKLTKEATGTDESQLDALRKSLCTDEFHDESDMPRPTENTGGWILTTKKFEAWKDGTSKKLWIHGDTGVGKTYLARNIISHLGKTEVVRCFLDGRSKDRNTSHAIFRSTIHQLATKYPDIWSVTIAQEEFKNLRNTKVDLSRARWADGTAVLWADGKIVLWEVGDLMMLWKGMVARVLTSDRGLVMVVDGFDEIPEGDQATFLDCLEKFEKEQEMGGHGRPGLGVLVLSRWCDSLDDERRMFTAYEITKEDNERDIRQTIWETLRGFARQTNYSEPFQNELCDAVTNGAQGTYLWATVMMADIRINRPRQHQLEEQLKQLPRSLAELFDKIIGSIELRKDTSWDTTRNVLLWVVFGLEPLGLQELNAALALTNIYQDRLLGRALGPQESNNAALAAMDAPHIERRLSHQFKAHLAVACGQLLSISPTNHVTTVHRALNDYLTTTPAWFKSKRWDISHHEGIYTPPKDAHAMLGHMCAAYLCMPSFKNAGDPYREADNGAEWELKVKGRIADHQLVRYAALCWSQHFKATKDAGHHADALASRRGDMCDPKKGLCVSWSEVWWYSRKWRALPFPQDPEDIQRLLLDAEPAGNSLVTPTADQPGRELTKPPPAQPPAQPMMLLPGPPADAQTGQPAQQDVPQDVPRHVQQPPQNPTGRSTGQSDNDLTEKEPLTPVVEEPLTPTVEERPFTPTAEEPLTPTFEERPLTPTAEEPLTPTVEEPLTPTVEKPLLIPAVEEPLTPIAEEPAATKEQLGVEHAPEEHRLPGSKTQLLSGEKPAEQQPAPGQPPPKKEVEKDMSPTKDLPLAKNSLPVAEGNWQQPLGEGQLPSEKQAAKQEQPGGNQRPEGDRPGMELIRLAAGPAGQLIGRPASSVPSAKEQFVPAVGEQPVLPSGERKQTVGPAEERFAPVVGSQPGGTNDGEIYQPAGKHQLVSEYQHPPEMSSTPAVAEQPDVGHRPDEYHPPEDLLPAKDLPLPGDLSLVVKGKKPQLPTEHWPLEEDPPPSGTQAAKQEQMGGESQQREGDRTAWEDGSRSRSQGHALSEKNGPATAQQPAGEKSHDGNPQGPMMSRARSRSSSGGFRGSLRAIRATHTFKASLTPLPDGIATANMGADDPVVRTESNPPTPPGSGGQPAASQPEQRESLVSASSYSDSVGSSIQLSDPRRRSSPPTTLGGSPPPREPSPDPQGTSSPEQNPPGSTPCERLPSGSTPRERPPPRGNSRERPTPRSTSHAQPPPTSTSTVRQQRPRRTWGVYLRCFLTCGCYSR
ncbi:hypothetical protein RB594_000733 [Gaeumannomyces avenae]